MFRDISLKLGLLKNALGGKEVKPVIVPTLIINISIFIFFVVLRTGIQVPQGLQEMWTYFKKSLSSYLYAEGNSYKIIVCSSWRMFKCSLLNLLVGRTNLGKLCHDTDTCKSVRVNFQNENERIG